MIEYIDFVPEKLTPSRPLGEPDFETLRDCLDRANAWIAEQGADVVNVETVVLPQLHDPNEEGSEDVNLRQNDDYVTPWNQFLRVWYRTK